MRLDSLELLWFRGAAAAISLELNGKSQVVYGANGSGKSSFVDAIEYALRDGRIGHLSHEYSGRHQEKGVLNTHKPANESAIVKLVRADGNEHLIRIGDKGLHQHEGTCRVDWDYQRTVLRQDEVAAFIHDTKGKKYSALLPLLGLGKLEIAADNVRKLRLTVERQSDLDHKKAHLHDERQNARAIFGDSDLPAVHAKLSDLLRDYLPLDPLLKSDAASMMAACTTLSDVFESRVRGSSRDHQEYVTLLALGDLSLGDNVETVRRANSELVKFVEPLVAERLKVLESSQAIAAELARETQISCPACGREIEFGEFRAHLESEHSRLKEAAGASAACQESRARLAGSIATAQGLLKRGELQRWLTESSQVSEAAKILAAINTESLRDRCDESLLLDVEITIPLFIKAAGDSATAPPDVVKVVNDRTVMLAAKSAIGIKELNAEVRDADNLVAVIRALEESIRESIRVHSENIIVQISADIQRMWSILHPGEPIEHINLYLPTDSEKAIDISLSFFGIEQDSPRLTLSEGHRNSLGLCIFLAMALRDSEADLPLFLDDVVVSLDRGHRGMIVDLLEKEFSTRQLVVLTHDRDWYTELRQLLDQSRWTFKTLLPYEAPSVGIRWSHKTTTFDDARSHLPTRADSAGNDARKIMDVELSLIAERLRVRLPFLRGHNNDHRMAHDFLTRLVADGRNCLEIEHNGQHINHKNALDSLTEADKLLLAWANRASHSFDVEPSEATKLIDACEVAVGAFQCNSCNRAVWFADVTSKTFLQCQCGQVRWRYGKA